MRQPIAALTSDWHFSEKVPACRAETPGEWLKVQEGYFNQLFDIAGILPIVCAGDVFDRWDVPASTINALIRILKRYTHGIYSIPGQHDLPNHSLEQVNRSAYWTLCEAEVIHSVGGFSTATCTEDEGLVVYGFPWGVDPRPCADPAYRHCVRLAVVHQYVWSEYASYQFAPREQHYTKSWERFKGYDAVVIGDNHKGWAQNLNRASANLPALYNPGTFVRRKADEISHKPSVGILQDDGTIEIHWLDTSRDRFVEAPERAEAVGLDSAEFLKELLNLADASIDYREAVKRFMKTNATKEEVREFVTRLMEEKNRG